MTIVFLDRDGVINAYPGDKNYVTSWEEFSFLPKAKEAIASLHKGGVKIYLVSNQAGVGKGLYTQEALDVITGNMLKEIKAAGGHIDGVYYCTHPPEQDCPCRKPKTGLVDLARQEHSLEVKGAFFIGDSILDIKTAKSAGCRAVLILSGKESLVNRSNWETEPDFIFADLFEAAHFILKQKNFR
ncbi:MAG: HAD family hydrolase [Candidatus Omnitrophota bacterium]|jgi:histidinol-phosphate phosphatase family protein